MTAKPTPTVANPKFTPELTADRRPSTADRRVPAKHNADCCKPKPRELDADRRPPTADR